MQSAAEVVGEPGFIFTEMAAQLDYEMIFLSSVRVRKNLVDNCFRRTFVFFPKNDRIFIVVTILKIAFGEQILSR